jgi:caa(3)-type oxidase subunit IV
MADTLLSHAIPGSTASPADAYDIQGEQKQYLAVYAVLIAGTVLTVAMYYVHFDAVWQTVTVALLIAAVKATFVAAVFMHLRHGQRDIYTLLLFTAVFAAVMLGLTTYSHFSLPGSGHYLR